MSSPENQNLALTNFTMSLDELLQSLTVKEAHIIEQAKEVISSYLDWWMPIRDGQLRLKKEGQSHRQAETGRIFPKLRIRDSGKAYINWCDEGHHNTKRFNNKFTREIPMTKKGYTPAQFKKLGDSWEIDKAIQTEEVLSKFRKALEYIHAHRVQINRLKRSM